MQNIKKTLRDKKLVRTMKEGEQWQDLGAGGRFMPKWALKEFNIRLSAGFFVSYDGPEDRSFEHGNESSLAGKEICGQLSDCQSFYKIFKQRMAI